MKCHLCEKNIRNYNADYHHLHIDDNHTVDICQECIDKFIKWQTSKLAVLFPTRAIKKRFNKNNLPKDKNPD